ncbi:hypothetical protein FFI87_013220 [Burkholderia sp. KBS0801]|nr:hypothetical protein FFI87_013220 [Burkholderia sp. KBS0801]
MHAECEDGERGGEHGGARKAAERRAQGESHSKAPIGKTRPAWYAKRAGGHKKKKADRLAVICLSTP